jgi:hypothetical protein
MSEVPKGGEPIDSTSGTDQEVIEGAAYLIPGNRPGETAADRVQFSKRFERVYSRLKEEDQKAKDQTPNP